MTKSFIGAFFQCYKNPYATYKALESFREHYPDSPILLLSDNGYNYEKMAEHFNCKYIHATENIPVWINHKTDEQYISMGRKLVERVCECFKQLNCEYILLLEDDVKVQNPIDPRMLQSGADIFGSNTNSISKEMMGIFHEKYKCIDTNKDYHYSGHGGSFYKRDSCVEFFSNKDVVEDVLNAYNDHRGTHSPTNMNQDQLLSLIIMLQNGRIKYLPGHVDCQIMNRKDCFNQHQYKNYYNQPMPSEFHHLVSL